MRSPSSPGSAACSRLLGVTATYAASGFVDYLPALRTIGGVVLVVMGLSLAGILRIPLLDRTWRPLDAGASTSLATATGSVALSTGSGGAPSTGDRIGGRLVSAQGGLLASFGLGAIFAIGWTPCIGIILSGILALAMSSGTVAQGTLLLVAYCIGLGLPFIAIALVYDRAPAAASTAAPARTHGLAHRRAAGRVPRRGDDLRLAGAPAALLHVQHGDLSGA